EAVDFAETLFSQLFALQQNEPGRIFMLDTGEHIIAALRALENSQIVAVALPHDALHGIDFMRHQIEDPKGAAGLQPAVEVPENPPAIASRHTGDGARRLQRSHRGCLRQISNERTSPWMVLTRPAVAAVTGAWAQARSWR